MSAAPRGPWRVIWHDGTPGEGLLDIVSVVPNYDYNVVVAADVDVVGRIATANVLESAWDLLQACKRALVAFEQADMLAGTPGKYRPIKDALRAIIRRAEGR